MPRLSHRFSSRIEADLAVDYLTEQGIAARVSTSDMGGAVPSMQVVDGVALEVSSDDLESAETAFLDFYSNEPRPAEPLSAAERLQGWAVGTFLVLVLGFLFYSAVQNGRSSTAPEMPKEHEQPW